MLWEWQRQNVHSAIWISSWKIQMEREHADTVALCFFAEKAVNNYKGARYVL